MIRTLVSTLALLAAGAALADPAVTTTVVAMRDGPSPRAALVQRIPADAQIDLNECTRGWCYASWRNVFGYIPASAAVPTGEPMPPPPPPFAVAPGFYGPPVVVGPTYGFGFGYGFGPRWRRW